MTWRPLLFLSLGGLFLPAPARAQVVHEHESVSQEGKAPTSGGKSPDLVATASEIVQRTNAFRGKEGRPAVKENAQLSAAAHYFAGFMARTDKYGHTADGNRPDQRAEKHGYEYCLIAENIAYVYNSAGFSTAELAGQFVTAWEKSPGHRKNMLDPDVTDTGVAVARSEKTGYYYAVQMFGRPKAAAIVFSVTNHSPNTVAYEIGRKTFDLPTGYTRTHTRCRTADLKIQWPAQQPVTVRPVKDDKFEVVKEGGMFRLKKD